MCAGVIFNMRLLIRVLDYFRVEAGSRVCFLGFGKWKCMICLLFQHLA